MCKPYNKELNTNKYSLNIETRLVEIGCCKFYNEQSNSEFETYIKKHTHTYSGTR